MVTSKNIIITGCSSGFGRLMVDRFAELGWRVLATTRHPKQLQPVAENVCVLNADVASVEGSDRVKDYVETNWSGKIDCLVNNAGYCLSGPLEMLAIEQIRQQMEVNFFAAVLLTRELLPGLRRTGGKIINLSSILGFTGMPLMSLYCASKFALEGWSESLYYELEPQGVQVALVEPAGYRTGFAQHMEWPSQQAGEGLPYGAQMRGFESFRARLAQPQRGSPAVEVVNKVVELTRRQKMPLRNRVGINSHALYYLRRLLPQTLSDFLIGRICNRLMQDK